MNSYDLVFEAIKRINPDELTDGELLDLIIELLNAARS